MKYKIGDSVKVIKSKSNPIADCIGKVGKIVDINFDKILSYCIQFEEKLKFSHDVLNYKNCQFFCNSEIELYEQITEKFADKLLDNVFLFIDGLGYEAILSEKEKEFIKNNWQELGFLEIKQKTKEEKIKELEEEMQVLFEEKNNSKNLDDYYLITNKLLEKQEKLIKLLKEDK